MYTYDDGIRRTLQEARFESLRDTMRASTRAADRRRAMRARLGLRLISTGERLACPNEAVAPRLSV